MLPSLFATIGLGDVVLLCIAALVVIAAIVVVLIVMPKTRKIFFPSLLSETEDKALFWSYVHEREYPPLFRLLTEKLPGLISRVKRSSEEGEPSETNEEEVLRILSDFVQFLRWSLELRLDKLEMREPQMYWRHFNVWKTDVTTRHTGQSSKRRPFLLKSGALVLRRDIGLKQYRFEVPVDVLLALGLKDALQIFCGGVTRDEYIRNIRVGKLVKLEGVESATRWFMTTFSK